MKYLNDYYALKKIYNCKSETIKPEHSDFTIHNLKYTSQINSNFPDKHECIRIANDNKERLRNIAKEKECDIPESLKIFDFIDSEIEQNNTFIYPIYKRNISDRTNSIIILLHGLNEKNWDKYHTWAKALLERTGKTILLFPISFHINRVPKEWTHPRMMDNLSKERKVLFPNITESSFVNAAISTRLQFKPETFFWSGLRTYYDIIKLITDIKEDKHPYFSKDASIDFFSYSIGAFLTEILLMGNYKNWFDNSRAFLFCGGPTISGMYPTSRYIYDSETYKAMTSFYVHNFEEEIKKSKGLSKYFKNPDDAAMDFKSMLNIDILKEYRESKLKKLSERLKALALVRDEVIPPASVLQTLTGMSISSQELKNTNNIVTFANEEVKNKKIPIDVFVMDFPFEYDHISPFPLVENIQSEVDNSFDEVFELAGQFLK